MKKIILTLTFAFFLGGMYLSAATGKGYTIKVFKDDKIVAELSIQSRASLDDAIEKLSEKFPNADRIEIEPANDSVLI